jgi:sugar phosphate isomerase/epimerase
MRLGISSYTYTWAVGVPGHPPEAPLTVYDLLTRAAALGVRVVQICDNLPLERLKEQELQATVRQARELDIEVQVGMRGLDGEQLRIGLRLARRFGSSLVRVVTDTADSRPAPAEIVRVLRDVAPEFAEARVHLAVENHDRFSAAELAAVVAEAGSPWVGVCLDTVNSFGALEGPDVVIGSLAPMVVNVHLKDFDIHRMSHQMGFVIEGRPAGQGQLDVPQLLGRLRAAGRDPDAILELWTPPESALAATLAKEARWAEESVAYLRRLIPD